MIERGQRVVLGEVAGRGRVPPGPERAPVDLPGSAERQPAFLQCFRRSHRGRAGLGDGDATDEARLTRHRVQLASALGLHHRARAIRTRTEERRAGLRVLDVHDDVPLVRHAQQQAVEQQSVHQVVVTRDRVESVEPVVDVQVHQDEVLVGELGQVRVHAHEVRIRALGTGRELDRRHRVVDDTLVGDRSTARRADARAAQVIRQVQVIGVTEGVVGHQQQAGRMRPQLADRERDVRVGRRRRLQGHLEDVTVPRLLAERPAHARMDLDHVRAVLGPRVTAHPIELGRPGCAVGGQDRQRHRLPAIPCARGQRQRGAQREQRRGRQLDLEVRDDDRLSRAVALGPWRGRGQRHDPGQRQGDPAGPGDAQAPCSSPAWSAVGVGEMNLAARLERPGANARHGCDDVPTMGRNRFRIVHWSPLWRLCRPPPAAVPRISSVVFSFRSNAGRQVRGAGS